MLFITSEVRRASDADDVSTLSIISHTLHATSSQASCVPSVSGEGFGSLEPSMADIGSLNFVTLGTTMGSITGFVSVTIPLELVPGISVGVLTKIFPLKCRGSDPTGGSC